MRARTLSLILLATVLIWAALGAFAAKAYADDPSEPVPDPVRVLLTGDSITQGRAVGSPSGGYSWRYFLWQRVQTDMHFVGNKTAPALSLAVDPETAYADPNFDYAHAGVAGARICEPDRLEGQVPINTLAYLYSPDVVVNAMGINDLRVGYSPEQVVDCYDRWLRLLRLHAPAVKVVVTQLPWAFAASTGSAFNSALAEWASLRSTAASPIVLARMGEAFTVADTYDGLHPTQVGEEKIGNMFAGALAALGYDVTHEQWVGQIVRPVQPPATPNLVVVRQGDDTIVARWSERARAEAYTLRCGGIDRTYRDGRTLTRFKDDRVLLCRVRASNYGGASAWSAAVRVG